MYGFLLRPRWIVRHVIVLLVVSLFALAGVWQLHRLHERRARNAVIEARRAEPAAELNAALERGKDAEHRRVHATGRYDTAHELVLLGRDKDGQTGNHVLTPLVRRDGWAVIVDRGWVPAELDSPPVQRAAPPGGTVVVRGEVLGSERAPFGGGTGTTKVVSLIELNRMGRQLPYRIAPVYVLLASQSPVQAGDLPVVVKPLPLTRGPHLSYAVQWFSFMAIALIGYGAFIRREALRAPV